MDELSAKLERDESSQSSVASPTSFINLPSPPNSERGTQAQITITRNFPEKQQHSFGVNTTESKPTSSWRDGSVSSLSEMLTTGKRLKLKL